MRSLIVVAIWAEVVWGQQPAPVFGLNNATFLVKLMSPLSTKTAQKGYAFTVSVEAPTEYQGGVMEGHITKLKAPKKRKGKGHAEMQFKFDTLSFKERTLPIQADLTEVRNSQGVKSVDEEGQVIGRTSNKKRAAAMGTGAGIGAIIGGAVAGGAGAAIGAAAGGLAGLTVGVKMTTTGSDIEFRPGSLFTLTVSDAQKRRR